MISKRKIRKRPIPNKTSCQTPVNKTITTTENGSTDNCIAEYANIRALLGYDKCCSIRKLFFTKSRKSCRKIISENRMAV
jgi:hypothetical protein